MTREGGLTPVNECRVLGRGQIPWRPWPCADMGSPVKGGSGRALRAHARTSALRLPRGLPLAQPATTRWTRRPGGCLHICEEVFAQRRCATSIAAGCWDPLKHCKTGGDCPSGQVCDARNLLCVLPDGSGGGSAGGGAGGGSAGGGAGGGSAGGRAGGGSAPNSNWDAFAWGNGN